MSPHGRMGVLMAAAGLLVPATGAHAQEPTIQVKAASSFAQLIGSWSGGGEVNFSDGKTERISCRAYYNAKGAGDELNLAIRCASASYRIEVRANLLNDGGRLSGRWEERTFNAEGDITGKASSGTLSMTIAGGISGAMSVSYGLSSQSVSISTEGTNLKGVSISLSRG